MTKYYIKRSNIFKKQYKKAIKQGKYSLKLSYIIEMLASGKMLDEKYKDHSLIDNKHFKGCRECHIEPDWLLVYKISNKELVLYLLETGSHADIFKI